MPSQPGSSEESVLATFHARKILTIDQLSELLRCSTITSRRRLKQWRALTSYNQNNRFYALPSVPAFDKLGLWHYLNVAHSLHRFGVPKHRTLPAVHRIILTA